MLAEVPRGGALLSEADAAGWPVHGEDGAYQVLARDGAPAAGVARLVAVVAEHHELVLRDGPLGDRHVVPSIGLHVRLIQLLPVDIDVAVLLAPAVARDRDQALDERAAGTAFELRSQRGLEDDDLAPARVAEAEDEPVREHPVGEAREAALARLGAVQRRLHR